MTSPVPDCPLCHPSAVIVERDELWTVALNDDQGYLGRCFFALNRHETDVTALSHTEITSLWTWLRQVKSALDAAFQPDHYNYVFLMNVQPHLHTHIIPRYDANREFAGRTFRDGNLGAHYDLANIQIPDEQTRDQIATSIRQHLTTSQEARP